MIERALTSYLLNIASKFPVVSLTGPRQAGKTTLLRSLFPSHHYVNLEDPSLRETAIQDPRSLLRNGLENMIIDEAQHVPDLFSWIQVFSDEQKRSGQFLISGSQNFLLMERITQSLAGRVAILHLMPLSLKEQSATQYWSATWEETSVKGGYPGPLVSGIAPHDFYAFYIQSYLERDVRQLVNVTDLERFRAYLSHCAGRVGQQVNFSALGHDIGIDSKTAARWLSVLETSFIVFRLPQFHRNFGKRLVKSPKLYFSDTGLAAYLLGIRHAQDIAIHFARGSLFENLVISELRKNRINRGEQPLFYYMRDNTGHEIDLLSETGGQLNAVEIKSGKTINTGFFDNLKWLNRIAGHSEVINHVVYGGNETRSQSGIFIHPWNDLMDV